MTGKKAAAPLTEDPLAPASRLAADAEQSLPANAASALRGEAERKRLGDSRRGSGGLDGGDSRTARVSDEPFDRPNYPGMARRSPKPGEPLWTLRHEHVTWSAELRFHGESDDWEARILRNGDLVNEQRFALRQAAEAWAEAERKMIGQGGA
jgi:hypothetical protein